MKGHYREDLDLPDTHRRKTCEKDDEETRKRKEARHAYYLENRDWLLARKKEAERERRKDPEYVQKQREYRRAYEARNRERIHGLHKDPETGKWKFNPVLEKAAREKRKQNPEYVQRMREATKRYYEKNRERCNANYRKSYKKNNDKWRETERLRRKASPEKYKQRDRKWYEKYKDKGSRLHGNRTRAFAQMLRKHKISWEDYWSFYIKQQGRCAICGIPSWEIANDETWFKRWNVDHCHTTGVIRGLLCVDCNLMLGKAKDSVETLERAIDYLRRY